MTQILLVMNRISYIILTYTIYFVFNHSAYSQPDKPFFRHLTTDNGLSFNSVYSIMQDKQGFIWIGTLDGLNRYDGLEIRNYRVVDKKYFQYVNPLVEDSLGNIWSGGILLKYNPQADKQQIIWLDSNDTLLWATGINNICIGPDKKLYLSSNKKLFKKNIGIADTVIYEFNPGNTPPEFSRINKLKFDKKNQIWLGTDEGLFYFDTIAKQYLQPDSINYPEKKYVHDFLFDDTGSLWLVFTNSILLYNPLTKQSREYQISGIEIPVLTTIYQTRNGVIWVGTNEQGLFFLDRTQGQFECLLDQNTITAIYEDRSSRLWIGTDNAGIFIYDSLQNFFKPLSLPLQDKEHNTLAVSKIIPADKDGLWIGTMSYGLIYYDLAKRSASIVDSENNQINMLYRDNTGKIWYDHVKYLVCYDPEKGKSRRIDHPVPLQFPIMNYGNSLSEMVNFNGKLIISSDYGQVYSLDPSTDKFNLIYQKEHYAIRAMLVKEDSLLIAVPGLGILVMDKSWAITDTLLDKSEGPGYKARYVSTLYIDTYDTLWAAGFGGISKYNPTTRQLENKFTVNESSNYLTSILEDDNANLWIGSSRGIYKYERSSQHFILFNTDHGMPPGRFFINSAVKGTYGMMYFGGNGGIVGFNPSIVKINKESPSLVFTDFIIHSTTKERSHDAIDILMQSINYVNELHLKYNQNSFTIKYAALNYTSTHHNQYQFKLEGLEDDWQAAGNLSQATYTNLDGGKYTFYVKGSNNDGVWNNEARQLTILIDPPPWKTWWAITIYILLILGIVIRFYLYNIRRIRLKHQLDIKTKESEKLKEIDEAKSHFFANISHEFRTPLSLIIDPASQLIQNRQSRIKEDKLLNMIIKNGRRLLFLINQILDLSKLKNNKLKLSAKETDIIAFIKPILSAFTSKADTLHIDYKNQLPENKILLWIDREKMDQCFTNLLSNAFKFCKEGEVSVEVQEAPDEIIIKISDTGTGIPANQLNKIFENYYQVDGSYSGGMSGTGIGLFLVKEYVEMHKGSICVESEENKGSIFTLTLLKGKNHLLQDQINYEEVPPDIVLESYTDKEMMADEKPITSQYLREKHSVLLVEDNPDMLEYLSESLSGKYEISYATNGNDGFAKTLEHSPDLIISDVMMPEMDGFTFCKKLKADIRTSHISIILLTARDMDNDKITGLSLGADDYMVKPFNQDELKLRIQNKINLQSKIRSQFLSDFRIKSEDEFRNNMQDQFLQNIFELLEMQYDDDQFGVEKLSELMHLSRKHLHHKIKTLTNQTPTELIRNFRLRKAAYLLSVDAAGVTQICYAVGFSNLSYFSKCFYNFFGQYPSKYNKLKEIK